MDCPQRILNDCKIDRSRLLTAQAKCELLEARAATLQQEIDRDVQGERALKLMIVSLRRQLVAIPGSSQVRQMRNGIPICPAAGAIKASS